MNYQHYIIGKINWWDPVTGRGSVISESDEWYRIPEHLKLPFMPEPGMLVAFSLVKSSNSPIMEDIRKVG